MAHPIRRLPLVPHSELDLVGMCRNAMGDENRIIRLKQSCSNDQTVEVARQKVAVCDLKKATIICAIDY